jgi:glycerophosphoryl diester phosphodiesterase
MLPHFFGFHWFDPPFYFIFVVDMDKKSACSYTANSAAGKGFFSTKPQFSTQFRKPDMKDRMERIFHFTTKVLYRRWPRKAPASSRLRSCRIVSHRGEHDNRRRFENTLEAFDTAADAGVWGLELDIRWTRDLVPVVFHDANTRRLYHKDLSIATVTLDALKMKFPQIPTLEEVINRYGGKSHLMIEIKTEPYETPRNQFGRMLRLLSGMTAGKDFHLMSLHPELFSHFDFLPARTFIPIAQIRVDRFSRMVVKNRWRGLAGHFLMLPDWVCVRHQRLGQGIGSGFVDSKNCLFREANRGVDWIFSNRAVELQSLCSTTHRQSTR